MRRRSLWITMMLSVHTFMMGPFVHYPMVLHCTGPGLAAQEKPEPKHTDGQG
jgi:hypothetical protein